RDEERQERHPDHDPAVVHPSCRYGTRDRHALRSTRKKPGPSPGPATLHSGKPGAWTPRPSTAWQLWHAGMDRASLWGLGLAEEAAELDHRVEMAGEPAAGRRRRLEGARIDGSRRNIVARAAQHLDHQPMGGERVIVEHLDAEVIAPRDLLDGHQD